MAKNRITIREIARMANVSTATVSLVLNNKKGVGEETRSKILKLMEETNYTPNQNSRRLFFQKSFTVGVVYSARTSPFENVFFTELARGMLLRARELGYNLLFSEMDRQERRLPDIVDQNDVDGVIFLQDIDWALLLRLNQLEIPFLVTDALTAAPEITTIKTDYHAASCRALRYLLEKGHREIAFISSEQIPDYYLQCLSAYKETFEEQGMFMNSAWIQGGAGNEETGYACAERILQAETLPTAIFCSADIYAIGAIRCLRAHGIRVPQQISVIGVDNILLSTYVEPRLTTVDIDKVRMGYLAMDLICKKISGETVDSQTMAPGALVERGSVAEIG